jgi:hypothetical protein
LVTVDGLGTEQEVFERVRSRLEEVGTGEAGE